MKSVNFSEKRTFSKAITKPEPFALSYTNKRAKLQNNNETVSNE